MSRIGYAMDVTGEASEGMSARIGRGNADGWSRDDRRCLWAVLAISLILRMLHLAAALRSPTTFFIGPDEDYYRRLGQAVAFGNGGFSDEFAFMDPLYGYFLGAVFWLTGDSLFPVFLLQVIGDTVTAALLFVIGRELGRPRAGLVAAIAYAFCATAILFSVTLLKEGWVSLFLASWMAVALAAARTDRATAWWGLGLLCGVGIALRANLLLMLFMAALLPVLTVRAQALSRARVRSFGCIMLGAALPLAILMARNIHISDSWSPLPNNGGVVLHQVYNEHNPEARSTAPPFVRRMHPDEIWLGYRSEAEKRSGRKLSPQEVDEYWRARATEYIDKNKAQSASNAWRKLRESSAWPEVPNNRSLNDERLFSGILRLLPSPFGWLFAFGVPGIVLLLVRDRRALVVLGPLLMAGATVVVFFAESRFRFGMVPSLALGMGLSIDAAWRWIREGRWGALATLSFAIVAMGAISLANAHLVPRQPPNWHRIAWGYVKMGNFDEAQRWASTARITDARLAYQPHELKGYVALQRGDRDVAVRELTIAAGLRPDLGHLRDNLAIAIRGPGSPAGPSREN